MDSISPHAVRTAGNQQGRSGVLTFFGKLVDGFWLGAPAVAPIAAPAHTPTQRASTSQNITASRLAP